MTGKIREQLEQLTLTDLIELIKLFNTEIRKREAEEAIKRKAEQDQKDAFDRFTLDRMIKWEGSSIGKMFYMKIYLEKKDKDFNYKIVILIFLKR